MPDARTIRMEAVNFSVNEVGSLVISTAPLKDGRADPSGAITPMLILPPGVGELAVYHAVWDYAEKMFRDRHGRPPSEETEDAAMVVAPWFAYAQRLAYEGDPDV